MQERDFYIMKDKDDCSSMKSLNIFSDHKSKIKEQKTALVLDKDKDICDTISATSFKSHKSGLSGTSGFMPPGHDYISEEPSDQSEEDMHEDEIEEVDEEERSESLSELEDQKKHLDAELFLLTSQLAPFIDRFGRALTDFAPHVAIMGVPVHPRNNTNLSMLSIMTNDGSMLSASGLNNSRNHDPQYPDHIARLLHPHAANRQRFTAAVYQGAMPGFQEPPATLAIPNYFLNFEVPVMLAPGELVHLDKNQLRLLGSENPVNLRVQTHVTLPGSPASPSSSSARTAAARQETPQLQKRRCPDRELPRPQPLQLRSHHQRKKRQRLRSRELQRIHPRAHRQESQEPQEEQARHFPSHQQHRRRRTARPQRHHLQEVRQSLWPRVHLQLAAA